MSLLRFSFLLVLILPGCTRESSQTAPVVSQEPAQPAGETQKTFVESVTQVVELRNRIRDGFAADDIDAAHDPLHEVGDVLSSLAAVAENDNISGESLETVKTSVNTLMDAFGAVDKVLHGGEGSTYEEEADTIDAALKQLAEVAGVDSSAKSSTDHAAGTDFEESPATEPEATPEPPPADSAPQP